MHTSMRILVLSLYLAISIISQSVEDNVAEEEITAAPNTSETFPPTQRYTRAAAVWGEPTPDYSGLSLGPSPHRIIRTLVFLDKKITEYYGYDIGEVRDRVTELMLEANTYFIQFRLGLVFVDMLQTDRSDLSLYSFQEYRNQRLHKLPSHDFAVLISFKYAGGLAFVGGMCTSTSVMLCGFFPQQPSAMGSIFFHEVAHLMGIPHKDANTTLKVPQCTCRPASGDNIDEPCLRIPGFDHDCTAQQLANVIYKNRCLRAGKSFDKSIAICGNGVVEEGEQCDCGLASQCASAWNCEHLKCEYKVHPAWLWMLALSVITLVLIILFLYGYWKGFFDRFKKPSVGGSPYKTNLKHSGSFLQYTSSPYYSKKNFPSSQVSPSAIVVLLEGQPAPTGSASAASIQRPKLPPPPPPTQMLTRSKISVQMPSNVYEIPKSRMGSDSNERDNLSWKFDDFDSGDEGSVPGSYSGRPGVPTVPFGGRSPINRVTVQFRGSDHTMSTACPSSSASDASLIT